MDAKIQLSPAEQTLIVNAEVLLTKNRVLEKMRLLLQDVQLQLQASTFSNAHTEPPPKISRGENYGSLPYLVLDYPRIFEQPGIFAIRSFFWWGRFFSSTLHLSGMYKNQFLPKLEASFQTFSKAHYVGINADPWQHHFEPDNYVLAGNLSPEKFKTTLHRQAHVKLATKLPVAQWQEAELFFVKNWRLYLDALTSPPAPGQVGEGR